MFTYFSLINFLQNIYIYKKQSFFGLQINFLRHRLESGSTFVKYILLYKCAFFEFKEQIIVKHTVKFEK